MAEKLIAHRATKLKAAHIDYSKVKWRYCFFMAILVGVTALPGCEKSILSPAAGPVYFNSFYRSTDTLYCRADRKLKLMLGAGGIAASAMLVDLIEIIKVK